MRAIGYNRAGTGVPVVSAPILLAVYLIVGAFVAATHHYFAHLHVARQYGSAALAILLWPLLLLGINLHIH
jgi:hypothetical protein